MKYVLLVVSAFVFSGCAVAVRPPVIKAEVKPQVRETCEWVKYSTGQTRYVCVQPDGTHVIR